MSYFLLSLDSLVKPLTTVRKVSGCVLSRRAMEICPQETYPSDICGVRGRTQVCSMPKPGFQGLLQRQSHFHIYNLMEFVLMWRLSVAPGMWIVFRIGLWWDTILIPWVENFWSVNFWWSVTCHQTFGVRTRSKNRDDTFFFLFLDLTR